LPYMAAYSSICSRSQDLSKGRCFCGFRGKVFSSSLFQPISAARRSHFRSALHTCVLPAFASFWLGDRAMNFQSLLVGVTLLVVSACASDPPAQAPVTSAAPPSEAVVVEQLPPPPDVVNVEKPAPRPKVAKLPDPKAPSKCKGLPQLACINVEECEWIKRTASTDRDGRPLLDYCGLKTATASAKE
jgi:hypothetical protein